MNYWIKKLNVKNIIYFCFFVFLLYWFRYLLALDIINSVDLNSHIAHIQKYKEIWYKSFYTYYNRYSFTGWSELQFYGFIPYLITVILSYIFDLFTEDSVRLSVHVLILIGLSTLIFSIEYTVNPIIANHYENHKNEQPLLKKIIYSLSLCFFCYWFLNHGQTWYGSGADAIISSGLYPQLFGWHLLLIFLGLLYRSINCNNGDKYLIRISILISLSLITHLITSIFMLSILFYYLLITDKHRINLLKSLILGISLTGFWLVPFLVYLGDYTQYNPLSSNSFLSVFLDYPIYNSLLTIKELMFSKPQKEIIYDYSYLFILILIISAFVNKYLHKNKIFIGLLIFLLIFILCTSRDFALANIPFGIHFVRFIGLTILLLTILLHIVLVSWLLRIREIKKFRVRIYYYIFILILICASFLSNLLIPNIDNKMYGNDSNYTTQNKIYDTINKLNTPSRVYIENLAEDPELSPRYSQHYIGTLFYEDLHNESINDIFHEQANSYHYITTSALRLNSKIYSPPVFSDNSATSIDNDIAIEQLKSFGINYLVAGTNSFYNTIKKYSVIKPIGINNYKIIKIQNNNYNDITITNKIPIGYLDLKGNLKFNLIDYYFYLNRDLTINYDLIEIPDIDSIPDMIDILIINSYPDNKNILKNKLTYKKVIFIDFNNDQFLINHYDIKYSNNIRMDTYIFLREYLSYHINLPVLISILKTKMKIQNENTFTKSQVQWSDNGQKFNLNNLSPGKLYRINYGYFPYWHTDDGKLLRGSGERMFFIPNKTEANFVFTKLNAPSTWVGWLLTIISISFITTNHYKKYRKLVKN